MIPWFFALPPLARKCLIGLTAVLVLSLSVGVWLRVHDGNVRKADRAERRAVVTEKVLKAERVANANDEGRRVVRERLSDKLDTAIDTAIVEHPDETNLPAGPATRAVLRELREQAARDSSPAD